MAGATGCQDDFAAGFIFVVNGIAVILCIFEIIGAIFAWVTQANLVESEHALDFIIPEFVLILAILVAIIILSVSMLGIIATAIQLCDNKQIAKAQEKGEKLSKKQKKQGCAYSWGMALYVCLCIFAFFFMLAVCVVSALYSGKLDQFDSTLKVKETGDQWIDTLESQLKTQVTDLASQHPKTWNATQNAAGCCGWTVDYNLNAVTTAVVSTVAADAITTPTTPTTPTTTTPTTPTTTTTKAAGAGDATATTTAAAADAADPGPADHDLVVAFTDSKCCAGRQVVTMSAAVGTSQLDDGCLVDSDNNVYTCEGIAARTIKTNLIATSVFSAFLAIILLALAIAACVVRYPQCFKYCDCRKKKVDSVKSIQVHEYSS